MNYFKAAADLKMVRARQQQLQKLQQFANQEEAELQNLIRDMKKARADYLKAGDRMSKVFIYYYFDGLSPRQIAQRIGCDKATVYRDLEKLKQKSELATLCDKEQVQ